MNRELKEIIGSYYDAVIEVHDLLYEDTKVPDREVQSREFILGEMLKIGKLLDYSDRFGAREMLQLMSEYTSFGFRSVLLTNPRVHAF